MQLAISTVARHSHSKIFWCDGRLIFADHRGLFMIRVCKIAWKKATINLISG